MRRIECMERPIDRQFARFAAGLCNVEAGPLMRLLFSMASQAAGRGDVCLDLSRLAHTLVACGEVLVELPDREAMVEMLRDSEVVGSPGEVRPLVLDGAGRLYLHRYWKQEASLASILLDKASAPVVEVGEEELAGGLDRLFPPLGGEDGPDRQRLAAERVMRGALTVICGGPGTGKTSTVVRILALLREARGGGGLRILMAAPTGKAAARLQASISALKAGLDCSEAIRQAIPESVSTIHRLLGAKPGGGGFSRHASNRLPCDVAIVDEASMVALPLMHAFLAALPPDCRLIIIGDHDQLSSVEPGAVLGDLCRAALHDPDTPLGRSMVMLQRTYRFGATSAVGALARAVNVGDADQALVLLGREAGLSITAASDEASLRQVLEALVLETYGPVCMASSAEDAIKAFERFRILAALREGYGIAGIRGLNALVERILCRKGLVDPSGTFYRGRPLMVTANDYQLRLFNGDTGIVMDGYVHFALPDGGIRRIPPERLPLHETAWAMTIHKSQGSEFDRVLMVLPPGESEILTRELIYTGITRAREGVDVIADSALFSMAIRRRTTRSSGLLDLLCAGGLGYGG